MFKICIDTPVPDLTYLKADFNKQLQSVQDSIPDFNEYLDTLADISFPILIGLPDPIFSGYSNIQQELSEVIGAIKYQADTFTMTGILKPLVAVVGGKLEDLLPKIPVLNFSIVDIINGDIQALYDAVKDALEKGIKLPFLPLEMFENFSNYAKESLLALKMILVGYKEMLLESIQDLIKDAMKILDISGLIPTLPSIPSIDELKQKVLDAFPDYKSWYEIITNVDMSKVLGIFGLGLFLIPELDFIPNFSNYEQYLMECFNQIKDYYSSLGLKMLVDFVENTLGMLNFSFPLFCIEF